jgi:ankyrin repeat protein
MADAKIGDTQEKHISENQAIHGHGRLVQSLSHAISCGDQITLASLLKEDHVVKLVDEADEQGLTPVHWALNCNNFQAFVQLAATEQQLICGRNGIQVTF